jgi:threonine/homoserine/homoserine lactone efflux protein
MALHTWLLYLLAAAGLSVTPGPNTLMALTHGALHGHRKTLWTIGGGAAGFTLLMALSMLGIGALIQAWQPALWVLKWVGGAYLVWLGTQLWRSPGVAVRHAAGPFAVPGRRLMRQGFLSAVSNPKALLFYGAFLPQFLDPQRSLGMQFAVMAATFVATEFTVEYLLARLAYRVQPWLARHGRRFNKACGALFALFGVVMPTT